MKKLERNQKYFVRGEGEVLGQDNNYFDAYRRGFLESIESNPDVLEKTAEEKDLLEWTIREVGSVAENFGAEKFPYKASNFHLLTDEKMTELRKKRGIDVVMAATDTGVLSGEKELRGGDNLSVAMTIAHEFFHMFAFNKMNFKKGSDKPFFEDSYRSGIAFYHGPKSPNQKEKALRSKRFSGFNEAITQDLTKFFYATNIRKSEKFKAAVHDFDEKNPPRGDYAYEWPPATWIYRLQVSLFRDICEKLLEARPDEFKDVNDVKFKFFRVYFSGQIKDMKPLLDIIDPGCFDALSEISHFSDLGSLEKMRDFRDRFGLKPDEHLNEMIKSEKNRLAEKKQH